VEETNRWMLRARDAIDRDYAGPLDIPALARIAAVSEAHFIRTFRATFGETPHRYLQRRRIERAMALLSHTDIPVTDVCLQVGFTSLGTFSRTFGALVGASPSAYRRRQQQHWQRHRQGRAAPAAPVPTCFAMAWTRPAGAEPASARPARASAGSRPSSAAAAGARPSSFGEAARRRSA
jgi:AraC-like DNA-binding protein